jgi:hypothetical protein
MTECRLWQSFAQNIWLFWTEEKARNTVKIMKNPAPNDAAESYCWVDWTFMRKFGRILLVFGFVWMTFFVVGAGASARALMIQHRKKVSGQRSYTREEVEAAYGGAAYEVAEFAKLGFWGGLLMLAGGIILDKSGRRASSGRHRP